MGIENKICLYFIVILSIYYPLEIFENKVSLYFIVNLSIENKIILSIVKIH